MTDYAILYHGAIDGVTSSCHQLMLNDGRSLIAGYFGAQWHTLAPGWQIKLHPAGHILGSAFVEVKLDKGLAPAATYADLREHWDAEAKRLLRRGRHPLSFEQLLTVDSHADHLRIVDYLKRSGRSAIVIAARSKRLAALCETHPQRRKTRALGAWRCGGQGGFGADVGGGGGGAV